MKHICPQCKNEFASRSTKRKYCTHRCYSDSRINEKRIGLEMRGAHNPNWRGGRRVDKDGYVLIHTPYHPFCDGDGYVREHRLVMEKVLVRFLLPEEVVHHKEDPVSDNHPDNLVLLLKAEHDDLPGHFNDRSK